jgi:hypothetical protein
VTDEIQIRRKLTVVCEERGGKAAIAKAFNIHPSTVARWQEGGEIPAPMLRLLDWYLFGVAPPRLAPALGLQRTLEFTEAEWRIVNILGERAGQTPEKWIAGTIRFHLDLHSDAGNGMRVADEGRGSA